MYNQFTLTPSVINLHFFLNFKEHLLRIMPATLLIVKTSYFSHHSGAFNIEETDINQNSL